MSSLPLIVEKLQTAQQSLLSSADRIESAFWNTPPNAKSWSAAQLVAHLCQAERSVLAYADRVTRKPALAVAFFRRFHLPIRLVESRIVKAKSPMAIESERLASKETMIAALRGVRERTLSFLEETREHDLSAYGWPHPFLGRLNFYEWFTFIAAHQVRHTKQLVEIARNLPNRVASSQK